MAVGKVVRAVIVGASSVLGKEVAERLNESTAAVWDLSLVDATDAGQVTAAGEEALVISRLDSSSFVAADVVFFAGDAATTLACWNDAQAAGASLVDLTGALEDKPGVIASAPGLKAAKPDLATVAMYPIHPAAWMLAHAVRRLEAVRVVATVMEPASQLGNAAMDELHQQTVALLTFQSVPKDVFDAQVAFTMREAFGAAAKVSLAAVRERVRHQLRDVLGNAEMASLEFVQTPVFHGLMMSAWLEVAGECDVDEVVRAMNGDGFAAGLEGDDLDVSNVGVTGLDDVLVRVRADGVRSVWLWMGADNVRWTARTAELCALEMLTLRPSVGVQ